MPKFGDIRQHILKENHDTLWLVIQANATLRPWLSWSTTGHACEKTYNAMCRLVLYANKIRLSKHSLKAFRAATYCRASI